MLVLLTANASIAQHVGVNGAACAFNSVQDAIAAAPSNATIYVLPGTYSEFLGTIEKNLTLVPSSRDCLTERLTATSSTVVFDGGGGSQSATGGLVRVENGASVTFRHMTLRSATATNGGVMAVTDGGRVFLSDADITQGVASSNGGGVYVFDGFLILNSGSALGNNQTTFGSGGAIAVHSGTLTINHALIGADLGLNSATNDGGGIYATGSTLNLRGSDTEIRSNRADANGGGIAAYDSSVFIDDFELSLNSADVSGGAIYIDGQTSRLEMTNSTARHNTASDTASFRGGGAIWANNGVTGILDAAVIRDNVSNGAGGGVGWRDGGSVTLRNGTSVRENEASVGGGVYAFSNLPLDVVVEGSTFFGNSASVRGGAIYLAGARLDIDDSTLEGNTADRGGAINAQFAQDVQIDDCTFIQNGAQEEGGAILADGVLGMMLNDTLFLENSAPHNGGTLWLGGSATTLASTNVQIGSTLTSGSTGAEGGGAIYIEDALEAEFDGLTISSSYSQNFGGGMLIRNGAAVTLRDSQITLCSGASGGGVYVEDSNLTIERGLIAENTAHSSSGGAIFVTGASSVLSILGAEIRNNDAAFDGGGILSAFATVEARDTLFDENTAAGRGGGLALTGGDVTVGGAIQSATPGACIPAALPADEYCAEFRGNTASEGGGVFIYGDVPGPDPETHFVAEGVAWIDNTATSEGSAIHLEEDLIFALIENSLIRGSSGGRAVYLVGPSELTISSSTLVANFGSPFYVATPSSTLAMTNTMVWDNVTGPFIVSGTNYTGSCNRLQPSAPSSASMGTLSGDPLFTSTVRGDYRLDETSPMVDQCLTGPGRDLDGFARLAGFDVGAFEYVPEPSVLGLIVGTVALAGVGRRRSLACRS